MKRRNIPKALLLLLCLSLLVRMLLAAWLELGNDEVYYYQYALYPSLSYFDHPPMVGWLIRVFTINLLLKGEWAVRLVALFCGTLNTWLIYLLGKKVHNAWAGFLAALLYTASFYAFIISGTFILPDAPQSSFWLLGMLAFLHSLGASEINKDARRWILMAGLFTGLGMLSKYTAVFLWLGAATYVLLYNRKWLLKKELYFSLMISFVVFLPVLIWNYRNGWVSFGFHGERVDVTHSGLHLDYFFREVGGQVFYNNPVNVVVGAMAMFTLVKGQWFMPRAKGRIVLLFSLPLIFIFPLISLGRETLPHWSGPGYHGVILIAASWLAARFPEYLPRSIKFSIAFMAIVILAGMGQIKGGWFIKPSAGDGYYRGKKDFSLDLYGWSQVAGKVIPIMDSLESRGIMQKGSSLVSFRWFPAAHLDYYVAFPSHRYVIACGPLHRIHHYYWINSFRGGLRPGEDAWYLVSGRDYRKPEEVCPGCWEEIFPVDTLPITRGGDTVNFFFLYGMKCIKDCESLLSLESH